ncbi:MAG: FAD-dependent oxidoreductase, partial [Actinomycetota bacterium]|nr:FAD-dependent oxidoreductase [Actinomycetota bacterium]
GWSHSENSVCGCYVEPIDTYCDMTHLIPRESWVSGDHVRSIAYVCGVLDDRPGETPAAAAVRVAQNARSFLNHDARVLWPVAVNAVAGQFRWDLLVDTRDGGPGAVSGPARFDSQYWRANVHGSERYVLTPAGSVDQRLPSAASGFANLVLAGDWTRNGIDAGCVEAAAISGLQAAHELIGVSAPILGADTKWLRLL